MRTLRGRVLLVVVSVALVSVVATALVADRIARNDLDEALSRDFEAEQAIYSELAAYAFFTGSWDGVDDLVDELADRYDERIAVTDLDGTVLADSAARPDGVSPELPPREVAFVDPFSDGAFIARELVEDPFDTPFLAGLELDLLAVTGCLDELGVAYELADDGLAAFPALTDPETAEQLEIEVATCFAKSSAEVPFDEPFSEVGPALLYLGEGSAGRSSLLADGPDWRLLALIAAVAVPAAVIAWAVMRPMFRPLASLGRAAQAVEAGDLTARADETGVEELASLSGHFNDMATSLESENSRRRQLTSDIAHELRTPLANVRGYLEAAQDGLIPVDAALVSVHDDTLLLQDLVDDLQTLSLADAGALTVTGESVSAADVVEGTLASHRAAAREGGVSLASDVEPGLLVWADRRRLRQVLGNLLHNAIRHTGPGGSVRVGAQAVDGWVQLTVADGGEGIHEADLERVFDRFARVDSSRNRATGGSGLGLAITRELVEAMGGRVDASSTPGSGSVFTVTLPTQPVA